MLAIVLECKEHPTYQAKTAPRSGCLTCNTIFEGAQFYKPGRHPKLSVELKRAKRYFPFTKQGMAEALDDAVTNLVSPR